MKLFWWGLLLLVSVLIAGRVYMHVGFPYTHDGENHLARFANYKIAVKEGQIPPRFAPNLMNRYGYPVFNYNYPLANILSLPFSVIHVPYETTFKIIALVALGLLGLGVAQWLSCLQVNRLGQFAGALAVISSPVVINMTFYRGNIGELLALTLIILLLGQIEQQLQKKSSSGWIMWLWAALLLSHNITAVFATPLLLIYGWVRAKQLQVKPKKVLPLLSSFGVSLLLVAWFWLPALLEKKLIVLDSAGSVNEFANHFATLSQILFAPLEFGFSYPGQIDTLSFGIGLAIGVSILLALSALVKYFYAHITQKQQVLVPKWVVLLTVAASGFIWLQLPSSVFLWHLVAVLKYTQFPWRFGMFALIAAIPLVGWAASSITLAKPLRHLFWLILLVQVLQTRSLRPADYFHHTTEDYDAYSQSTSTQNENRTRDFEYTNIGDWKPSASVLSGEAQITTQIWRGSNRQYQVTAPTPVTIVEPTMLFAGWQTFVDGKQVAYEHSPEIAGRLAFQLPAGEHHVKSIFTQYTWPRMIGNGITLLGLLYIGFSSSKALLRRYHVSA